MYFSAWHRERDTGVYNLFLTEIYIISCLEIQLQECAVQILVFNWTSGFNVYVVTFWLSGGRWEVSLKLREICPCMGIRDRGRKAISSPVVLQPVPRRSPHFGLGDIAWFTVGFFTAVLFIAWLLSD